MNPPARNPSAAPAPRTPSTLVEVLGLRADGHASLPAFTFLPASNAPVRSLTFAQLHARADAIAAQLTALGLRGERALLLYPAGLEFVEAFFGCLMAGVIAVPGFPPRPNRTLGRLAAMAADAGARVALCPHRLLERSREIAGAHPALAPLRWIATDEAGAAMQGGCELPALDPHQVAYLQYTSGSTSTPKGVMVSHASVLANSAEIALGFGHTPASRALSWLPHYHDMGLIDGIVQPVYSGFHAVLMDPASFLQTPARWLESITAHRITHTGGPNFAYDLCTRRVPADPATLDLSSWAVAYNGAEPVRAETLERFAARYAPCGFQRTAFYPAYGLAEATLKVSGGRRGEGARLLHVDRAALEAGRAREQPHGMALVACGRAEGDTRVAIVDPATCREQAELEVGEIWVAGPSVALGYWNRPDETAQTFGARLAGDPTRFLRTGDLGFKSDGALVVTGRLKDLVIVRGRNVYPQDIEATVAGCHPSLRPDGGAAFAVESGGEERLVVVHEVDRHGVHEPAELLAAMRAAVVEVHEVDPAAIVLVRPGAVPRTSSGKVQRAACRSLFLSGALQQVAAWRAPAPPAGADSAAPAAEDAWNPRVLDDARRWLRARVAAVLGTAAQRVPLDQPLARLGLDSLRALELAHDIQRWSRVAVSATDLLAAPSLGDVAHAIVAGEADALTAGPDDALECPLSAGQSALWFLQELVPVSRAYTIASALRLRGPLDEKAFEAAARDVVARHASLRARIVVTRGVPRQRFDVTFERIWDRVELPPLSAEELAATLADRAHTAFDLERGPLFRLTLLRAGDERVLLVCAHHAVADLWSLSVVLHDLQAAYARQTAPASALEPAPHPEAFVRWQSRLLQGDDGARQLAYWRAQLSGELPTLDLPTDRTRPLVHGFGGGVRTREVDPATARAVRALAREQGVTLYTLLLAAYQAFLSRITGQPEVLVGVPATGRTAPGFAGLVAYLVNAVVLRADMAADPTFDQHVRATGERVLSALAHQDYPFGTLVRQLAPARDPSRSPLFDTMFDLHAASHRVRGDLGTAGRGACAELGGGVTAEPVAVERRASQFDLSVTVTDDGHALALELEYSAELFDAGTVDALGAQFETLLRGIVAEPTTRLSRLPLLTDEQRAAALRAGNVRPKLAAGAPVHRLFEQEAARCPRALAAVHGDASLTYAELNQRSNAVAQRLRVLGVGPEVRVALCFDKSLELLVALLGVLKAGGTYVPIDPALPAARRDFMLRDARARVVLAAADPKLDAPAGVALLSVDAGHAGDARAENPMGDPPDTALAYLIYTSGTTGTPKGVGIAHASLTSAFCAWEQAYGLRSLRTHLQMAAPGFDVFTGDVVRALCSGGTLVLCDRETLLDPPALAALARAHRVEFAEFVPATLRELAVHLSRTGERLDSLVQVAVGSDVWSMADCTLFRSVFGPATRLLNSYGVTEATIDSTLDDVGEGGGGRTAPAIGRPLLNSAALVLDRHLEPVPPGVQGELYLGGPAVARGYEGRPDLTAQRFVPDPHGEPGARLYRTGDAARRLADGRIEFVGRSDGQVKIRGNRIELAEVEAALKAAPEVGTAVVVAIDHGTLKRLVAYVTIEGDRAGAPARLRAHLSERLPEAMVPAAVVVLDRVPLTVNGKVDRRALPAPSWEDEPSSAGADDAPRAGAERTLAAIWSQVLGVARIGRDRDFFELGGDSILSIQMVARARDAGLLLTPRTLFEHPTVASLARAAAASVAEPAGHGEFNGPAPLLPIQRWFFEQEFAEPDHWNMGVALDARRAVHPPFLQRALAAVVEHHGALRARFTLGVDGWSQAVPPGVGGVDPPLLVEISDKEPREHAVARCAARLHAGLSLTRGPLVRVGLVHATPVPEHDPQPTLVFVAHHLVVDGVSLRILLEDLERALGQLERGEPVLLPAKTASPAAWAVAIERSVREGLFTPHAHHWQTVAAARMAPVPLDGTGDEPLEGSTDSVSVEVDARQTAALLRSGAAGGARVDELLVAALAQAWSAWTGASALCVEVEGHGRSPAIDVDVTRTVGWFTETHPVWVEGVRSTDGAATVAAVVRALRAAPGLGFTALRWFAPDAALRAALAHMPTPPVSFNYLGRFDDAEGEGGLFTHWREPSAAPRAARARRTHLLEIDASVVQGNLRLRWRFSPTQLAPATVAALADSFRQALSALVEARAAAWSDADEVFPLTPMQEGMLFHHLRGGAADPYVAQIALELAGEVDPDAMARAFQAACDAHPALRTAFVWEGLERPVQVVRRTARLPVELHQLEPGSIDALMASARAGGFEVTRAPLARVDLVRTGPDAMTAVFTHHHLLLDGWSLPFVLQTVFESYERLVDRSEPRVSSVAPAESGTGTLRRYMAWLEGQDVEAAAATFRALLRGLQQPTPLSASDAPSNGESQPRGSAPERTAVVHAAAPSDVVRRARALGLTPSVVVQAGWALVLAACSGESDVVFGATSSGRPPEVAGIESLVGLCINTLPVRAAVDPRAFARDWMHQLQQLGARLRQYEHVPLARIQAWGQLAAGTPLFESLLVFENYPIDLGALGRRKHFDVSGVRLHEQTNYPLTIVASGEHELRFRALYDRDRWSESEAALMLARLGLAIDALLASPDARLGELSLLTPAERERVVHTWNQTARPYPREASLVEVFEAVARAHPQDTALRSAALQVTYGELRDRAHAVACALRSRGVLPETRVGLAMERSPELIAAILGILYAGGAYVPIDPESPPQRTQRMLEDAGVELVIDDGATVEGAGPVRVPFAELAVESGLGRAGESLPAGSADSLAYVMFTSGSTGHPKGVEVTHRNVLRLVLGAEYVRFGPEQCVVQLAPVAFDASTFEIWGALLHGACLELAPPSTRSAAEIAALLERTGATTVWLTAGLFHVLVDEHLQTLAQVPQVVAGGDVLDPDRVRRLVQANCARLVNGYGPTETTTFACCDVLRPGAAVGKRVPIGAPIANTRAYVLDAAMQPVPAGAPGELYLGGDGVARGYARRPDATAERFVPDPFGGCGARLYRTGDIARWRSDGRLEFLGRRDGQVKVRGFRVEVGEVEAALAALPGVRAAAVVARVQPAGTELVGVIVPDGDASVAPAEIRALLSQRVPRFMVPTQWRTLDALPLTQNGKVDRRALAALQPGPPQSSAARLLSPVEAAVAQLWCRVLGLDAVGPDEDFFELGGHSLHATRLLAVVRRAFRVELPMAALLEATTVAGLARALVAHEPQPGHVDRAAHALAQLRGEASVPPARAHDGAAKRGGVA